MKKLFLVPLMLGLMMVSCESDDAVGKNPDPISNPDPNPEPTPDPTPTPVANDIEAADKISVDRFSLNVGHLQVRTAANGLPEENAPINFDEAPFITKGLDKNGASIRYYNFDVQSIVPIPVYVFYKKDGTTKVENQNNVLSNIPGDNRYSDFGLVHKVLVPDDYIANTLISQSDVFHSGYEIIVTSEVVNCPVVPFGSTASRSTVAGEASKLVMGWYKGKAAAYFNFPEPDFKVTESGLVPTAPIFVMYNIDPIKKDPGTGAASGFMLEPGTDQTHNVLGSWAGVPSTPLWNIWVISNVYFDAIVDLEIAAMAPSVRGYTNINCPVLK